MTTPETPAAPNPVDLNREFCALLGIDPAGVVSVSVFLCPGRWPRVSVKRDRLRGFGQPGPLLQRHAFDLVPVGAAPSTAAGLDPLTLSDVLAQAEGAELNPKPAPGVVVENRTAERVHVQDDATEGRRVVRVVVGAGGKVAHLGALAAQVVRDGMARAGLVRAPLPPLAPDAGETLADMARSSSPVALSEGVPPCATCGEPVGPSGCACPPPSALSRRPGSA